MRFSVNVKNKFYAYFTQRLGMEDYTRGWLKSDCPFCGKHRKFGVQIEDNKAHCFSCEYRNTILGCIFDYENLDRYQQVYELINTFEGVGYYKLPEQVEEKTVNLQLPEDFKLLGLYESKTAKMVEHNLIRRGFKIDELMKAGVGYCAKGKYGGRIIIPYYHRGKLIYFNARQFVKLGEKFKNPTETEVGIGKSNIIYNIDALYLYDTVRLYESATNCLTMGNTAIGTGGKSLSRWQKDVIISSPVKRIIIGLDDDAWSDAVNLALELSPYKKIKLLKFPEGKDANDLGKKAVLKLEKEHTYQTYKDFLKLKFDAQAA